MRITFCGFAALATSLLTGCLVPEKFSTSVSVQQDGSYTYRYEGTVVSVLAAAQIKEKGSISAKDEDALKKEAESAVRNPQIKKSIYRGNGRYEMQIEELVKSDQQSQTLKLFSVTKSKEGVYSISPPEIKAKDVMQLKSLGIKIEGTAEVILPTNAKVISHNATDTPGFFSKSYKWKLSGFEEKSSIRFTLPQ